MLGARSTAPIALDDGSRWIGTLTIGYGWRWEWGHEFTSSKLPCVMAAFPRHMKNDRPLCGGEAHLIASAMIEVEAKAGIGR